MGFQQEAMAYNVMAQAQINLSRKQSLSQIIFSCDQLSKQHIRLPKLGHSFTHNPEPPLLEEEGDSLLELHLPKMQRFKLLNSLKLVFNAQRPSPDRARVKTETFARHVNLTPQNRVPFRRIVEKYRRNFHPSNASRGLSNTSDVVTPKTPRKVRELRVGCTDREGEGELKRMAILSQVISENNRKEMKLRKDKSRNRQREGVI